MFEKEDQVICVDNFLMEDFLQEGETYRVVKVEDSEHIFVTGNSPNMGVVMVHSDRFIKKD